MKIPSRTTRIEAAGASIFGTRSRNEDGWMVLPSHGLAMISDGMGGFFGGEIATTLSLRAMQQMLALSRKPTANEAPRSSGLPPAAKEYFDSILRAERSLPAKPHSDEDASLLAESLRLANARIASCPEEIFRGMGAAVAALLLHGDEAIIAHVGDCRVYRFREHKLEVLTRDHTLAEDQTAQRAWAAARSSNTEAPIPKVLLRAIGVQPELAVDTRIELWQPNDLFLLTTDGVTDVLSTKNIEAVLANSSSGIEEMCSALLREVQQPNGADNATVCVVRPHEV